MVGAGVSVLLLELLTNISLFQNLKSFLKVSKSIRLQSKQAAAQGTER